MNYEKHLWQASKVVAPDFPRQSSDAHTVQASRGSRPEFVSALKDAVENENDGYYSVYSFPRGHSKEGNIPKVDCVFIDLDITGDEYRPDEGQDSFEAWRNDMSALLARARMIARVLRDSGKAQHFRAVLSGHKGIHLYLDFPEISPDEAGGSIQQFKNGLGDYGEIVTDGLQDEADGVDIDPWIDVDASDLGRLARHPNTKHPTAAYDDKERWCVPISIDELAGLQVEDYLDLTTGPRPVPEGFERCPSETAHDRAVQAVRRAPSSRHDTESSTYDPKAVRRYKNSSNDDIELEDALFLLKNKPCVEQFRQRSDAYDHHDASRAMELSIMGEMMKKNVPVEVMHEFFEVIPGYDEDWTDSIIHDLIGRGYQPFNCETICDRASQFCLGDSCKVYRRSDDLEV